MTNLIIDTTRTLWQSGRKTKKTGGGWISGNAVCCIHNNQSVDKRGRGGLIVSEESVTYSCFNCNFKCGYRLGQTLSSRFKNFLIWLGIDKLLLDKLAIDAAKLKDEMADAQINIVRRIPKIVSFSTINLPEGSVSLDQANTDHKIHIDYLHNRGLTADSYEYYVTPNALGRNKNRIVIPYYYNKQLVGYTSRFYDNHKPKYVQESQRGYVFNLDAQYDNFEVCILVEGQFDAISIGGAAYMGSTINDEQVTLIGRLNRKVIVVPDKDISGMSVCDRALELGYHISLPSWSNDVKDVNDAVKRYGKLSTLLSILQSATTNKIKIEMEKKKYK